MTSDDFNDDTLEQATTLLRDVPLPAFPADAIAQHMRTRIKPVALSTDEPKTSAAPNPMRMGPVLSERKRVERVSWFSRVAAMIVIGAGLLAVGWAMFRSNPAIAFALVTERLHAVHAFDADVIVNSGGIEMHGSLRYAAPGRFRVTIPGAAVEILDMNLGKFMLLNELNKSASVLNLDDAPSDFKRQELDWIEKLRNVSRDAGKPLGRDTIDGVRAMKFSVMDDGQEMFVWADAATGAPICIEATLISGKEVVTMKLEHLAVDPVIDEKQFRIEVPPGYTVQSGHVSAAAINPDDLITFLKEYVARTGTFPPSLVDFKRSLKQMAASTTRPASSSSALSERKRVDGSDASLIETVTRAARAMLYLNQLSQTASWSYAGATAQPGNPAQPIFWYRATNAQSYTIIYADYHTAESAVAPVVSGAESPGASNPRPN